jgi:ABC-2 type transport system permease protein
MSGYLALTKKELRESLKTSKLLIAAVVFLLAGAGGVILTYYLPDLVRNQTGSGVTIIIAKQTDVDAVDAYVKNVLQIPTLAIILLAMGSVADERAHGVGAMILSRPVSRVAYILAKLTGHGLTLLAGQLLGAIAAFYYIALLFNGAALGPYVLVNLGLAVSLLDVLAITLLCSTILRSGVAAGGLAFVLYVLLSSLPGFWSPLGDNLPGSVIDHAHALLAGTWGAVDLVRPLFGGLLLAAACSAAACLALRRQEA